MGSFRPITFSQGVHTTDRLSAQTSRFDSFQKAKLDDVVTATPAKLSRLPRRVFLSRDSAIASISQTSSKATLRKDLLIKQQI